MTPARAARLYNQLATATPRPRSELTHRSHFELLVAVILSAQATDKSVNKVTPALFPKYNTPAELLGLGEEKLFAAIRNIGLARSKARHIIATCRFLLERHQGQVPNDKKSLQALAGVGQKTANVILNVAFGHPTIAVDTHVFRIANRTGLARGNTVRAVEEGLLDITPRQHGLYAHHYHSTTTGS